MEEQSLISTFEAILKLIAIAAPGAGLVGGAVVGTVRHRLIKNAATGLGVGLLGTLIYGLWKLYIAIGESFGNSRVGSVGLLAAIFLAVGFGIGVVITLAYRHQHQ